jgi:hypothetical protein
MLLKSLASNINRFTDDEILKGRLFCISYEVEGRFIEMKITRISCMLVVTFLLTVASAVMASDFSCGSKIITTGDHSYDVLRKCGEPSHVEAWEKVRVKRDFGPGLLEEEMGLSRWSPFVKELVTVEEWEYNWGSNRFIRYLRFENGRLIRITVGDYGY